MATNELNQHDIIQPLETAVSRITTLMQSVDDDKVNASPYTGSWTAPQLLRHVSKSIAGMAQAVQMQGKPADRDPAERVPELKAIFLNFSTKMQSPDFIVPEDGPYKKDVAINDLDDSFAALKHNIENVNLTEIVEGLPFGPVTKFELLNFSLFHTQRHLHQMEKICSALDN